MPLWQTPVSDDAVDRAAGKWNSRGEPKLSAQVKLWTTPCADDTGHRTAKYAQGGTALSMQAGGSLNPPFVEWLMAFPLGFTVSRHWVMPKSPCKPQSHGNCSEVSE